MLFHFPPSRSQDSHLNFPIYKCILVRQCFAIVVFRFGCRDFCNINIQRVGSIGGSMARIPV